MEVLLFRVLEALLSELEHGLRIATGVDSPEEARPLEVVNDGQCLVQVRLDTLAEGGHVVVGPALVPPQRSPQAFLLVALVE